MRELECQIITYLRDCGEDTAQFDTEHVATVLWRLNYTDLGQVPTGDFTRLLIANTRDMESI